MITRYCIGYLLTSEMTSTQVQLLSAQALQDQALVDPATGQLLGPAGARWNATTTPDRSWSPGRTAGRDDSTDTREFMG